MLAEVKKCAESNDIKGLHYIFVDCLDVDPTFEKYKSDYEYCKSINGFLESHVDMTPFLSKERWNKQYWEQLKLDLMKNFSDKRFTHMMEVARIIYSDKIERLKMERTQKTRDVEVKPIRNVSAIESVQSLAKVEKPQNQVQAISSNATNSGRTSSVVSNEEIQKQQILEKRRALELHNQQVEKEQREQKARIEAKKAEEAKKYNMAGGNAPKKAMGVAIAALAIIAIIVVIVLIKVL